MKIYKCYVGGILCLLVISIVAHADDGADITDLKAQMSQEMAAIEIRLTKDAAERETRLAKEAAASESRLVTLIEEMRAEMKAEIATSRAEMKADNAMLRTELVEIKYSLPSAWSFYLTVWGAAFSIIVTIMITMTLTIRAVTAVPRPAQSRTTRV